ncbi:MAG TPA: hypothetical protein PKE32_05115 [Miltoncostaeaceae bacterium]|nr:hypothetical protein [Miltoncostaeaceae bacterium]
MAEGPKREAVLRGFMALVLDMVRVDPDRKPSRDMIRWYEELAGDAGLTPADVPTARALLEEGLRLMKAGREHQTTVAAGA